MILIRNVRLIDPVLQRDIITDVGLKHGQLTTDLPKQDHFTESLDGQGLWLMPAVVDLSARLREPGQQQHGSLKSEGLAARAGGILHVVLPPDTRPVLDSGSLLAGFRKKAYEDGKIHLHIIGALTQGLNGQQPANLAGLKQGGCIAVSNARAPFANDDVLLRSLEYAATLGLTVFFVPEEPALAKDGCVHDGFMASRQGLTGIPELAETVALSKQLLMVRETGVKAHFCTLSAGASVDLIRQAKAQGLPVTTSVAMHQLYLTDAYIDGFNALAHVRPPLREQPDLEQLRQALADGVIDAICSHHEPLSATSKLAPFADTEAGISAFDTFMALGVQLVHDELLTPLQLAQKIVTVPADITGIETLRRNVGGWVLVNPEQEWTVNAHTMVSQGKNTPFLGQTLTGRVVRLFDE